MRRVPPLFLLLPLLCALFATPLQARPLVVELYTSQGCAACPPADALLGEMTARPDILPLSFHVDYWDYLGYKDPFALAQSARRQKVYNTRFRIDSLFTPQMVVDGLATAIGSHKNAVGKILAKAAESLTDIPVSLTLDRERNEMAIRVAGLDDGLPTASLPDYLDVWLVTFQKGYKTPVDGGENVGRELMNYNIVRRLVLLGKWNQRTAHYRFPLDNFLEDALAVLVQEEEGGRILGAAVYYQR